jgi:hypothetical protein
MMMMMTMTMMIMTIVKRSKGGEMTVGVGLISSFQMENQASVIPMVIPAVEIVAGVEAPQIIVTVKIALIILNFNCTKIK